MTRFNKLKEKIEQERTRRDISYDELENYLNHYRYYLVRTNGSHHIFKKNDISISIPVHNNKVKATYVRKVSDMIKGEETKWH